MTQLTTFTSNKMPDSACGTFIRQLFKPVALSISAFLVLGITACGGGGVENRDAPPPEPTRDSKAKDIDAGYYADTIHGTIFRVQQCVNCHVTGGSGRGEFADVNESTAYSVAKGIFNPADITFDAASPVSDTNPPTDQLDDNVFVTKVSGGHYCWGSCASSAQQIVEQLRAWVVASKLGGTLDEQIDSNPRAVTRDILDDPPLNDPIAPIGFDKQLDFNEGRFDALYAIVTDPAQGNCLRCHTSTTTDNPPQRPFFAESGYANAKENAYNAVVSSAVVNLNQPGESKLVVRPWPGQHNCGGDCQTLATSIQAAITTWSNDIKNLNQDAQFNEQDTLRPSKALTLSDGQVTSGGARYDDYVIAKYEFKEGSDDDSSNDNMAMDTSGVGEPLNLRLLGNVRWVGGYGLEFGMGGLARSTSTTDSQKLHDLIVARGEYSLEAWVIPENTSQEGDVNIDSAVIMSYSSATQYRNFTMGQDAYQYKFRNRVVDANGSVLDTDMNENLVQTSLQHVVMTYSDTEGRRIYVNGEPKACETDVTISGEYTTLCPSVDTGEKDNAPLTQWDTGFILTLGSDTNGANQWLGKIRFAAIHRKALSQREIKINYDAGVGQKFNLLFNISHLKTQYASNWDQNMSLGDRSYIWFEVAEYDDYSYLFSEPKYIDLAYNADTPPAVDFSFRGMRIGINGKEATVGQAFARLGKSDDPSDDPASTSLRINSPDPVSLTRLQGEQYGVTPATGTIIPKDVDVNTDQFFLTFEMIGGVDEAETRAGEVLNLQYNYTGTSDAFVVGLRTFDAINTTMAALTGVDQASVVNDDPNNDALKGFNTLKGQLPAEATIAAFSASQQTAIASLAGRYCDKRVDDQNIVDGQTAEQYFGVTAGFFNSNVATAFSGGSAGTAVSNMADALIINMVRDVNTLGDGDPDALNNVIKPELISLAAYLLGENDATTALPQPHSCVSDVNSDGNPDQDCTGTARTKAIAKAMCTAVLSSAVVTHK
ncbi:MAG: hypothetical protein AMJ53_17850 [Gammaproteobacteria bacterium SG8_11]|nr:MAG: hypothetical protein AMJ53_17850 [Gammaproteobacteria bacterium SG8_11]